MNQSSTNEAYNLLSLASQIVLQIKERARHQSVASDVREVWEILGMLGLRPSAIGSTAAELRQLLITGHIAEARRIFLNPPGEDASMTEKNAAFKALCDNLVAALKMPPPPAPSLRPQPMNDSVTCAVVLMNDPFQNLPKHCVQFTGATQVEEFLDDGIEHTEVSDSDIQVESTPLQTLQTQQDHVAVERFFGSGAEAQKFGFAPTPRPYLSAAALLAEMSDPPPVSQEQIASESANLRTVRISEQCIMHQAHTDYAS